MLIFGIQKNSQQAGCSDLSSLVPSPPVLAASALCKQPASQVWLLQAPGELPGQIFALTLEPFLEHRRCACVLGTRFFCLSHVWQVFLDVSNSWLLTASGARIVTQAVPAGRVLGLDLCRNVSGERFQNLCLQHKLSVAVKMLR